MRRRLLAIMAGDVVGYSRMMAEDEAGTYRELRFTLDEIVDPAVDANGGRVFKQVGDGFLATFASVHDALEAAAAIQAGLRGRRFRLRIGVNLGDVIEENGDTYGDGVNVAARLEAMAEPGAIFVSEAVVRSVEKAAARSFRRVGRRSAKNMPVGLEVYAVAAPAALSRLARLRASIGTPGRVPVAAGLALVVFGGVSFGVLAPDALRSFARTLPFLGAASADVRPSVAVMPFANIGGDPSQSYFSDGLTEDLITELSRNPDLAVVARNSTFALRDDRRDARLVGRTLGARYVVEGSARRDGGNLRVSAQLVDAESGTHLWARNYDRRVEDVFAIQADLTAEISASLVAYMRRSEAASASRRPTDDLRAYDLVLRAREVGTHAAATPDAMLQSRDMLRQALALDANYAAAHAYLGLNLVADVVGGVTGRATATDLDAGIGQAREAIRLQPDLALGYRVLGFGLSAKRDYSGASEAAARAVELGPNDPENLAALAKAQLRTGDYAEAADNAARARQLHPMAPNYYAFVEAQALYAADRLDDAMSSLRECLLADAQRAACLRLVVAVETRRGRSAEAKEAMRLLRQADPAFSLQSERETRRFGETAMMDRYIGDLASAAPVPSASVDHAERRVSF